LINLEFSYRFNNIANYIQNSFKEAIDEYKKAQNEESSNLAEITSPSTPMQSIRLLYGAGGSGKTSLLAWFIK